eukprot:10021901-Lingulodinium_polyedra.AAC.1
MGCGVAMSGRPSPRAFAALACCGVDVLSLAPIALIPRSSGGAAGIRQSTPGSGIQVFALA